MDAGLGSWAADDTDGFARTLAGAGVGLGSLAAHRQAAQMADATVAFDSLQPLKVHTDITAQIAFDDILAILDRVNDLRKLLLGEILGADTGINFGFGEDDVCVAGSNAINGSQRDFDSLVGWNFDSDNAGHKLNL